MLAAPFCESAHDLTTDMRSVPENKAKCLETRETGILCVGSWTDKNSERPQRRGRENVHTPLPSMSMAFMPFKTILTLHVCEFLLKDEDPPRNAGKDLPFMELALAPRSAPRMRLLVDKAFADATFADARKAAAGLSQEAIPYWHAPGKRCPLLCQNLEEEK